MPRPCRSRPRPRKVGAGVDYGDSMAVLGPLSFVREPHSFDLCDRHARLTSAPQGWQLVRLSSIGTPPTE